MKNIDNGNYDYCKYLELNEALKERDSCFDENGNNINPEKFSNLMKNKNFVKYSFSKENLVNCAKQDEDLSLKGASELFLGAAYPPSWYWEMPDYYYPGLYGEEFAAEVDDAFENLSDESKLMVSTTRNEAVLQDCGWFREKYDVPEYFNIDFPNIKIVFEKNSEAVSFVSFDSDTKKELSKLTIPFYLLCGLFLKCREMEFPKPWQLRAHDYKSTYPDVFERKHNIIRDEGTNEIIEYGDWEPTKQTEK